MKLLNKLNDLMDEWLIVVLTVLVALLIFTAIIVASDEAPRPEEQWVMDPKNGCEIQNEIALANHSTRLGKHNYQPKILTIYYCHADQVAAIIKDQ